MVELGGRWVVGGPVGELVVGGRWVGRALVGGSMLSLSVDQWSTCWWVSCWWAVGWWGTYRWVLGWLSVVGGFVMCQNFTRAVLIQGQRHFNSFSAQWNFNILRCFLILQGNVFNTCKFFIAHFWCSTVWISKEEYINRFIKT